MRVLAPAFESTSIRGLMVIPLHTHQKLIGVISIFRAGFDQEILWAGQYDPNHRQKLPRFSFAVWREQRKGQAQKWKSDVITTIFNAKLHN